MCLNQDKGGEQGFEKNSSFWAALQKNDFFQWMKIKLSFWQYHIPFYQRSTKLFEDISNFVLQILTQSICKLRNMETSLMGLSDLISMSQVSVLSLLPSGFGCYCSMWLYFSPPSPLLFLKLFVNCTVCVICGRGNNVSNVLLTRLILTEKCH